MYGAYVHVPWCRYRCPYCAFVVDTRREPPHDAWRDAVLRDWERERPYFAGAPTTLSFGGGTPSRADPRALAAVVRALGPTGELSMEVNPDDVDAERLAAWRDLGVSRLSVGVQSFQPALAPRLGRAHAAREAHHALDLAQAAGFASISVDLLFGHPDQTDAELDADLAEVARRGLPHVSVYSLSIEPGSRYAQVGQATVEEDRWVAMYERVVDGLGAAGLPRYEVSNFARPGHRSVHNELYWRARPWAGLGPGAHGWRPDLARVANPSDVDAWMAGAPPEVEEPAGEALLFELVWSTLRHVDGVDRARVRAATGVLPVAPRQAVEAGLMTETADTLRLERGGFALSDALAEAVVRESVGRRVEPPGGLGHTPRRGA